MSIYKKIKSGNVTTSETEVFKTHTLDSSLVRTKIWRNYTIPFEDQAVLQRTFQSNYNSLKSNFYLSGSNYSVTESRYDSPFFKKGYYNSKYPQYFNKFHTGSSSDERGKLYSIPQHYVGDYIKPGTFSLTDTTNTYPIQIVDDKYGNIYARNAIISQSNNSMSSSDNYIGNIFYQAGIVTITAGHEYFSGSATYNTLGTNFSMSFQSAKSVYVSEYSLTIEPNEFNKTNNPTAKAAQTGSAANYLAPQLTGSKWSPYFHTVGFYDDNDICMAKATYPQNIKTRKDIPIILKIKMDW